MCSRVTGNSDVTQLGKGCRPFVQNPGMQHVRLPVLWPSDYVIGAVVAVQTYAQSPRPQIDNPKRRQPGLEGKASTWFAGEISAFARVGDKLVDLAQNSLGAHQGKVIGVRQDGNLALREFSRENVTVEILKFQTG